MPSSDRLALAGELRAYGTLSDKQASIRRRVANYIARERHLSLLPAASLTALLVVAMVLLVDIAIAESSHGQGGF